MKGVFTKTGGKEMVEKKEVVGYDTGEGIFTVSSVLIKTKK